MTFLEAINQVMVRLRESEVTAWDVNTFSKLIGRMVNDAKREVEDAHEWHALRTTKAGAVAADDASVVFDDTNQRTRMIQVFNDTGDSKLHIKTRNEIIRLRSVGNASTGQPCFYSLKGYNSEGAVQLEIWPTSDGAYDLSLDCIVPQADLASNATIITVAPDPIVLRALALALAERGDDAGTSFNMAMAEYRIALDDAINRDKDNGADYEAWHVP